jgi:predicted acylesterase/phospholipase RssA
MAPRNGQAGEGPPAGRHRFGLALAGGGPEGAVYEIGALRALDEALEGLDFNHLDVYVGVSAGSVIAASLANQIDPAQLCRAIVSHEPGEHPFIPETFLTPAGKEWARRSSSLPRLLGEALGDYLRHPVDNTVLGSMTRLGRALPVGVFENDPLRAYLESVFSRPGRTDDFRRLASRLYVVAADLDSARAVRFGEPGLDQVPISKAVQASTALPGLYPPVEIDGRFYVDGVLLKTLHASVALEAGADLVFCVNPIVPVDTVRAVEEGVMRRGRLIDRGLPGVLSQTFRTLIQSRLEVGMRTYERRFEGRDVVLFQPRRDDYLMFFTNIFSFDDRVTVCEHGYRQTRRDLRERRAELEPILARHGISIRDQILDDEERDLWSHVGLAARAPGRRDLRRRRGPRSPKGQPFLTDRLATTLDRLDRLVDRPAPDP